MSRTDLRYAGRILGTLEPSAMAVPLDPSPNAPQALAELSGTVLGHRYALGQILGAGGMGAVFEARDLRLERAVAIKVLRPVFVGHTDYIKRFLREAQAASKIRHRNVVVILDYGEAEGGFVYSVMELFIGQDLEQLLRGQPEGRLPWAQVCELLIQIASGLKAAHRQGVIHRDIKPANCFLTHEDDEPVVKVVDFGIAKLEDAGHTGTSTGNLMGTPSYIAPELIRTLSPASSRSDVYSLGVMAYRMLAGRLPFTGDTAFEVMRQACMDPVRPLREQVPEVPAAVEGLVLEMLAKEPGERPADMGVVRQRLQVVSRETLGVGAGSESRETGREMAQPPHRTVEITAAQVEPLHDEPAGSSTLPAASPLVGTSAPTPLPMPSPSRSGETQTVLIGAQLSVEDLPALARPRRRRANWPLGAAVALLVTALGAALGWLVAAGNEPEDLQGEGAVAMVEAEQAGDAERPGPRDVAIAPPPPDVVEVGSNEVEGVGRDEPVAGTGGTETPVVGLHVVEESPSTPTIPEPRVAPKRERSREVRPLAGPQSDPARSDELTAQADVMRKQGLRNDAKLFYGQAISANPNNGDAHLGLAIVHFDQGSYDQALEAAEQAVKHSPRSGAAHKILGDALFKELRYEDAKAAYEEAQRLGVNVETRLTEVHKKLGQEG